MLVIISDLHLTDGTSGEILNDKAFRIFRNRISDMAYDVSWRKPESLNAEAYYQPIDAINILLLGDIIDIIRSEEWNHTNEIDMPWTEQRGDAFFAQVTNIINGVLENNKMSFAVLKDMTENGIKIPASMRTLSDDENLATQKGFEASDDKVALKVNIYYMVGNHDWFLYINDERLNDARNLIIDNLGLANKKNERFPYYPSENDAMQSMLNDHNVYAIHGDIFDETNYTAPDRDGSSVGDVIVLKLLNEIPNQIELQLKNFPEDKKGLIKNDTEFIKELREIDNLRPYSLAAQWISHIIKKYELDIEFINDAIRDAFKVLINDFIENPLVSQHRATVIKMQLTSLLFRTKFTIEDLASVIEFFALSKDVFESYRKYAKTLTANGDYTRKSFYVMGHTHYAEIVPMSSYMENGNQFSKIYLNTGTWRAQHRQAIYDKSFISYKTITFAGFFKGNERNGHSFEYWTGYLDL